jgi:hypothetical protein
MRNLNLLILMNYVTYTRTAAVDIKVKTVCTCTSTTEIYTPIKFSRITLERLACKDWRVKV